MEILAPNEKTFKYLLYTPDTLFIFITQMKSFFKYNYQSGKIKLQKVYTVQAKETNASHLLVQN